MRSSTVIAIAAVVVAPALVSALPTPQDGVLYARQAPRFERPTPAATLAAHQKEYGQDHEHYHEHGHDGHDEHGHDHEYKYADHEHQPQRAVNAVPAAGHVAREAGSGALTWGGVWKDTKDVATIGKDGYDAYKAGKDAYDSLKGKSRRSSAPLNYGGKAAQGSGSDGKSSSPFKQQSGGHREHSHHRREVHGGKAVQSSGSGVSGGHGDRTHHRRLRFQMGNVALPQLERLMQNKVATRELVDILAREQAGSGAINFIPVRKPWSTTEGIPSILQSIATRELADILTREPASSDAIDLTQVRNPWANTGGISGVWKSIATRELADILAREDESGAINWGGVWNAAKDAYHIGKDGYDAYEAGKDAYNSIKSSRSLLDELD